jgi:hypothetical protein
MTVYVKGKNENEIIQKGRGLRFAAARVMTAKEQDIEGLESILNCLIGKNRFLWSTKLRRYKAIE